MEWAGRRALAPALLAGLALAVLPAAARLFSTPKLALLGIDALLATALALRAAGAVRRESWLALAWLAGLCASTLNAGAADMAAVVRDASAALLLLALLRLRPDPAPALRAAAAAGTAVALVVLAQRAGLDVFGARAAGRLALHGTLGNPDFAAAWLCACLPLTLGERHRAWLFAAAIQTAALAALGSFGSLVALGAAALVLPSRPRGQPERLSGDGHLVAGRRALLLLAIALVALGTAGRDPVRVSAGRAGLHAVALPHLADAPLLGGGPGSTQALTPGHVHDDWLERALEIGLPATLALAALAALAIRRARGTPIAAALAALAARAFVDFPLSRPAELGLFVVLVALAFREEP